MNINHILILWTVNQTLYVSWGLVLYPNMTPMVVQFNPLTVWVVWRTWHLTDDSAKILFQCFLQEATVSSSGMGRDIHSLTLSIQHFLCWPQHHPPSKVLWRMVLEMMLWRVTCPNHVSFCLSTIARRGSCGSTRQLILLHIQFISYSFFLHLRPWNIDIKFYYWVDLPRI